MKTGRAGQCRQKLRLALRVGESQALDQGGAVLGRNQLRQALGQQQDLLHQAVAGQPSDMADGEAGVKSLAVALAVLESARTGRSVAVQYGARA